IVLGTVGHVVRVFILSSRKRHTRWPRDWSSDVCSSDRYALGDNAYPNGTEVNYTECYQPTWGRFKKRTHPVPGNHDYDTPAAPGYFGYFGVAAGERGVGYYSYDLGAWHIIALNSNLDMSPGSPQERWLRADLAAHPKLCTLAYWHHARFSSGTTHGSDPQTQPLWQALYEAGADV